jgi:hypothetical protein
MSQEQQLSISTESEAAVPLVFDIEARQLKI